MKKLLTSLRNWWNARKIQGVFDDFEDNISRLEKSGNALTLVIDDMDIENEQYLKKIADTKRRLDAKIAINKAKTAEVETNMRRAASLVAKLEEFIQVDLDGDGKVGE